MLAQAFDAGSAAPGSGAAAACPVLAERSPAVSWMCLGSWPRARRTRRSPKSFLSLFTVKHVGQILASSARPTAPKPLPGTGTGPVS